METTQEKKSINSMEFLEKLGIKASNYGASTGTISWKTNGKEIQSFSPVDGKLIGTVNQAEENDYEKVMVTAQKAFEKWRLVPAPKRGEIVRFSFF